MSTGFDPDIRVIGHRGARALAPENTLAGLRAAAAAGAQAVEIDLRLTGDGAVVLMHDADLARTTDGDGLLAEQSLEAVRRLDAGSWFGAAFAGEGVPTLTEALDLCVRHGLGVILELKPAGSRHGNLVRGVAAALENLRPQVPVLVSSFDRDTVLSCGDFLPRVPRALIAESLPGDGLDVARQAGCRALNLGEAGLTPQRVAAVVAAGFYLYAWTVNRPQRARALLEWGVAGIITDDPPPVLAQCSAGE